jgi:hypothetical protein
LIFIGRGMIAERRGVRRQLVEVEPDIARASWATGRVLVGFNLWLRVRDNFVLIFKNIVAFIYSKSPY